jgi:SAM-dependent methyltransferase
MNSRDHQCSIDLEKLTAWQEKPPLFEPGEPLFWDDPYISQQMLAYHLDPETDVASRKAETIDKSVAWILQQGRLKAGDAVLDLGCGPGLYASRLAKNGLAVTGIDISKRSIRYARDYAGLHDLKIDYRNQNYLTLADENCYQAALLIYGDYCTFSPDQRALILSNIHRALKPGGFFVLDVTTRIHRQKYGLKNTWYISEGGFWRPGRHLVLEWGFAYPELNIYLDQYIVIDTEGCMVIYRNWFQDFDGETITTELEEGGFEVESLWGDLMGSPYQEDGEWIGVLAKRKN